MITDVKLDADKSGWATIEGAVVNAKASDLILESPARRTKNGGPYRRALVHNENDGLTVNFNGDYPGGVRIHDALLQLRVEEQDSGEMQLPKSAQIGELRVVRKVIRAGGVVMGEETTLWLCTGYQPLLNDVAAEWSPINVGDIVLGTR